MEIEIVEFYKRSEKGIHYLSGSIHAYIIDLGLDLRFINIVMVRKGKSVSWKVEEPFRLVDKVKVPYFIFMDKKKQKEFLCQLRQKCLEFIKEIPDLNINKRKKN